MQLDALAITDLDAAMGLSRQAGWNQVRADWRRLLHHPAARCFAGRVDGELVATATITYYDQVCWIGMVLVDDDHRRQGYGTTIVQRAFNFATDTAETVGLDATDAGRPLYRDIGFVDVTPVERWCGVLDERNEHVSVERVGSDDLGPLSAYDEASCGVDRGLLLGGLLDEPRTTGFVARSPEDCGYAVLRPGREHWQFGPVVADGQETLEALLAAAADELDGDSILVDVIKPAPDEIFTDYGLSVDRTLTRMCLDRRERLLCGDAVHAAAGLELG